MKGKQQPLDPREKARQEQLERDSGVRAKLEVIRENVTNILQVIERIARHAPKLALDNLESLSAVSTPLLSSKLLHGEALETTQALAKCLPSPLDRKAGDLANCLWLILGPESHRSSRAETAGLHRRDCWRLQARSYLCSCVLVLVPHPKVHLLLRQVTPMHEEVVHTLILHTTEDGEWPFGMTAEALYNLWNLVPSHRVDLETGSPTCAKGSRGHGSFSHCKRLIQGGCQHQAGHLHMPAKSPLWAAKKIPPSGRIAIPFWIALHDPDERVSAAADALWNLYGHGLPVHFIDDMVSFLNHSSINTVEATAAALGEAVEEYPETAEAVVGTLVNSFEGLGTQGRVGIGLALKECATVVDYSIMRGILDFLLLRG